MSAEMNKLKSINNDLTTRVQYLEQGYVNRSELDGFFAMVMNTFEMVKAKQDALFSMVSQTSTTIQDSSLCDSIMGFQPMFESPTDSYDGDSFDGLFNENPFDGYVVNEVPQKIEQKVQVKNRDNKNSNNRLSSMCRPELTESTEVVSLNF